MTKKKLIAGEIGKRQMFDWCLEAFTAIGKRFDDLEKRIETLEEESK